MICALISGEMVGLRPLRRAFESALFEALLPMHDHGPVDANLLGHSLLAQAVATQEHDTGTADLPLGGAGFAEDFLQRSALLIVDGKRENGTLKEALPS